MLLILFLLFSSINSYAYMPPIFTNARATITSFPNINHDKYTVQSYQNYLNFSFPVTLSPFTKIKVFGMKYGFSMYIDDPKNMIIIRNGSTLLNKFSTFRINLSKKIINQYPNQAGFILAIVLGNKYFLDAEFLDYVRASGVAHIFALSGLHLAIFISIFLFLGNIFGLSLKMSGLITLPCAVLYLFIGGMGISLQRAFLFYLIWLITTWTRTPLPLYKMTIIALLINVITIPKIIFSLSFIMSYMAIFGIIFFHKKWRSVFIKYLGQYFGILISISLSAGLAVLPITIWVFGEFNILFLLANLIIVPIMPFVISLNIILVLLMSLGLSGFGLEILLDFLYKGIYFVVEKISTIPNTMIFFTYPKQFIIILLGVILAIMAIKAIIIRRGNYDQ